MDTTPLALLLALSLVPFGIACGGDEFSTDPTAEGGAGGSTAGGAGGQAQAGAGGTIAGTGGAGAAQAGAGGTAQAGTGGTAGSGEGGSSGSNVGGSAGSSGAAGISSGGSSGSSGSSGEAGSSGASGEAGQAGEAGTGGSGGAPECSGDVVGCFEEVPKACIEGSWVQKGGACNWGCSSGACTCGNDSRFIAVGGSGPVLDVTTKLSWTKVVITTPMTLIETKAWCGNAYRLPARDEVLSILAEQAPASLCQATQNMDASFYNDLAQHVGGPDFPTPASLFDVPVWTTDTDNGKAVTVRLNTGEVGSRDPNEATKGIAFCLQKVK